MRRWTIPIALWLGIFVSAIVSIQTAEWAHTIAPIWPSNAVALAFFLRGRRCLSHYATATTVSASAILAVELLERGIGCLAFMFTLANMIEVVMAAVLLHALYPAFDIMRFRSLIIFLIVASIAAPLAGATLAVGTLFLTQGGEVGQTWIAWYAADALGMAIVGPFAVAFNIKDLSRLRNIVSSTDVMIVLAAIATASALTALHHFMLILLIPVIAISAFRLGIMGTAFVTFSLLLIGTSLILYDTGTIIMVGASYSQRLFAFQAFIAVNVLWAIPVSALVIEHRQLLESVVFDNRLLGEENARKSTAIVALHRTLNEAEDRERLRLARELHDEAAQVFAICKMDLKKLSALVPTDGNDLVRALREHLDQIAKTLHYAAWRLRPAALDESGLVPAVHNYLSEWADRYSIHADFLCTDRAIDDIPVEIRFAIFRFIQEALTNVARHAQASVVSVVVGRVRHVVNVSIEDNGRGFDPDKITSTGTSGLGLRGMQERVALHHGRFEVQSSIGNGTTIFGRFPFAQETSD